MSNNDSSSSDAGGPELSSYDRIIVAFSGGKDSLACLLHLLEVGIERDRIELWHHDVDGREGSTLMDWACTAAYCQAVADAFGIVLRSSWRVGGLEGEFTKVDRPTAAVRWEPTGELRDTVASHHYLDRPSVAQAGGSGKARTRDRLPMKSANLMSRYCSAVAKIDVADIVLKNELRFRSGRTLFITGERAEESTNRARYSTFEPHRADLRDGKTYQRHVDHWRPVLHWSEQKVWAIIERFSVNVHPAYRLGFGRVSCAACIFGSKRQFATTRAISPHQVETLAKYERRFNQSLNGTAKRKVFLADFIGDAPTYDLHTDEARQALVEAQDRDWDHNVIMPAGTWTMPAGAFGESAGPV